MKIFKAFSLIEVLVVLAIVGVIAAVGIPTYIAYTQRAQMSEVYQIMEQQFKEWQQQNDTKGWTEWTVSDQNRPVPIGTLDNIFMDGWIISYSFAPGNYNREGQTYVVYTPYADGVEVQSATVYAQLSRAKTITWECDVSGSGGVYYGGFTPAEFQEVYFPNCTCNTC